MQPVSADDVVFLRSALGLGLRLDGRAADEERGVELSLVRSDRASIAEVCFGATRVVGVTRGEIVTPYPDRPNDGLIQFTASGSHASDKAGFTDTELSRMLDRAIRESDALDTESLCVVGGEKVWSITCSVTVLDYHGNLTDACIFAAMASLRCFRKPEVSLSRGMAELDDAGSEAVEAPSSSTTGGSGVLALGQTMVHVFSFDEREPLPLALHHTPLSVTMVAFKGLVRASASDAGGDGRDGGGSSDASAPPKRTELLIDPSTIEEMECDTKIGFCFNAHGDLCSILKPGQASLGIDTILAASGLAAARASALHTLLGEALAAYEVEATAAKDARLDRMRRLRQFAKTRTPGTGGGGGGGGGGSEVLAAGAMAVGQAAISIDDKLLDFNNLHEAATLRQVE